MRSLSARLLVAVSILLLIALSLTAIILDRIFRNAAEEATEQRLDSQLILLMSSADIDEDGELSMPDMLPEARFMNPSSGLLGFVNNADGMVWKSDSSVGIESPVVKSGFVGQGSFTKLSYNESDYFQSSLFIEWEVGVNTYKSFVFTAAESLEPYYSQLAQFRTRLFSWFAFLIALIVFAQALLMSWVLKPLRKIAHEVSEIDQGQRALLSDDYPSELLGVTTNTNSLIKAERSRLERYQNTLGNLAHSLKTPLAVIQAESESSETNKKVIVEQVTTMNDIVSYQLKRAATVGQVTLGHEAIAMRKLSDDLIGALKKVYADKNIHFTNNIHSDIGFHADKGDLTEVLGNLLDNAAKWSKSKVTISANSITGNSKRQGLHLIVEDDGQGVGDLQKERILQRGQRADENIPGHGIGLSIVKEIVSSYQGTMSINRSDLGGARFEVKLSAY